MIKKFYIPISVLFFVLFGAALGAVPIKIMPLGDSITGTPGCWRAFLWDKLQKNGYTNIDFVGTQSWATCSIPYDQDGEGHGSILACDIADQNQLPPWLASTLPDIVLMHLGTNDIMGNKTIAQIIAAFDKMVDQMRASNPNMKILVAQIIPMYSATTGCTICYQGTIDLKNAIVPWASGKTTSQSPVVPVDCWTGFDTATDTSEGIHPNDIGNQKIADKWYPALIPFLSASGTTAPTAVPTTAPTPVVPTPTAIVRGDANMNGTIDIVDALLVAQYYVGLNPAGFIVAAADTNCSGSVDIVDALLIAQYYVGLIAQFC
jgi:lysophospholipase L1-like esterase